MAGRSGGIKYNPPSKESIRNAEGLIRKAGLPILHSEEMNPYKLALRLKEAGDRLSSKSVQDYESAGRAYEEAAEWGKQANLRSSGMVHHKEIERWNNYSHDAFRRAGKERSLAHISLSSVVVIALGSILCALMIIFSNFTANVIGTNVDRPSNIFGAILLIIGAVATLIYLRRMR